MTSWLHAALLAALEAPPGVAHTALPSHVYPARLCNVDLRSGHCLLFDARHWVPALLSPDAAATLHDKFSAAIEPDHVCYGVMKGTARELRLGYTSRGGFVPSLPHSWRLRPGPAVVVHIGTFLLDDGSFVEGTPGSAAPWHEDDGAVAALDRVPWHALSRRLGPEMHWSGWAPCVKTYAYAAVTLEEDALIPHEQLAMLVAACPGADPLRLPAPDTAASSWASSGSGGGGAAAAVEAAPSVPADLTSGRASHSGLLLGTSVVAAPSPTPSPTALASLPAPSSPQEEEQLRQQQQQQQYGQMQTAAARAAAVELASTATWSSGSAAGAAAAPSAPGWRAAAATEAATALPALAAAQPRGLLPVLAGIGPPVAAAAPPVRSAFGRAARAAKQGAGGGGGGGAPPAPPPSDFEHESSGATIASGHAL